MQEKFIDTLFSKILEYRYEVALSSAAVKSKLQQLEDVGERIRKKEGEEARNQVLDYKHVKHALEKCREYLEGNPSSLINEIDFHIYYEYAYQKLQRADTLLEEK